MTTAKQQPKPAAQASAPPARTPESTPVPGGGSWRWDYTACRWIERLEPPAAAPVTATEPTPE